MTGSGNGYHSRKEDTALYRWLPVAITVLGPVLAIGIAWGALSGEVRRTHQSVSDMRIDVSDLREQLARSEEKLNAVSVTADIVSELAQAYGQQSGRIDHNYARISQLLERVKELQNIAAQNEGNLDEIAEVLRQSGATIRLERRQH